MGQTLAETRLEIDAQRAQLQQTADRLRARVERAVDIRAKLRENPLVFAGLGAGAVFLLAGGPSRVARLIRRRVAPTPPEKAYDSLPKPLQDLVDTVAERVGPRAAEARQALALEVARWRHDPRHSKKMEKRLAKELVEGPPGPGRTAWRAFEAAAAILSAALARKAGERFLSGEPPIGIVPAADAVGTLGGAAEPERPANP
ncbi:MAG: hypothetical protein ABR509_02910 [Candidatus Limnocylindria bacterium]